MATTASPYGFRPVRDFASAPFNGATQMFRIPSGTSGSMYTGMPVALNSSGVLIPAVAALAGYVGIFMGCEYEDPTFGVVFRQYWPGGTVTKDTKAGQGYVAFNPDTLLRAQCTVASFDADANIGKRLTISLPAAPNDGNTATGNSKAGVTATVSATGEFLLLGRVPVDDNPNASGYVELLGVIADGLHIARKA